MSSIVNLVNTNYSKDVSILEEETLLHPGKYQNEASGKGVNTYMTEIVYGGGLFVGNNNKTYYSKILNRSKLATQIFTGSISYWLNNNATN